MPARPTTKPGRTRSLLFGAGSLAALALLTSLALGTHRGLLLSSDIKSRCWPWAPFLKSETLAAPSLSDPVWQFVPWLRLARRELAAGELPLWNPHQDGGVPLLGNASSALLSPLVWPALLFGVEAGWNLSLLLRVLLAAGAAFAWLRELSRSTFSAALGAVAFALSGAFVAWLEHTHTLTAAAVPLLLLFARRVARGAAAHDLVGLALSTFLVLAGGHPETALMAGMLVVAVVAADRPRPRGLAAVAAGGLLGAGLASPALLTFVEYFAHSEARWGAQRRSFTLPLRDLLRFVLPRLADSNVIEGACAVSIPLLLLVPLGLALRPGRETGFWAAFALVILLAVYDNPLSRVLALRTPVYWTRLLLLLPLALAVLATAGLDALSERLAARGWTRPAAALPAVIFVVSLGELLGRARGVHAVTPASQVAFTTPLLEFLRRDPDVFRVLPLHNFLPANTASDYALDDVRGYDALAPAGWRRVRSAMGRFGESSILTDAIEPGNVAPGGRALDFWNVKYLLLDPRFSVGAEDFNAKRGLDVELVYSGPDGKVFRNRRALPRARLDVPGTLALRLRKSDRWIFQAELSRDGAFLLANPFFPGWRASIDGRKIPLSLEPGAPIECRVPAGKHAIEIAYEPRSWSFGVLVSVLAAAGLLVLGWRRPFGGSRDGPAAGSPS